MNVRNTVTIDIILRIIFTREWIKEKKNVYNVLNCRKCRKNLWHFTELCFHIYDHYLLG